MATAEVPVITYACQECGTLLKSKCESLGKKRRCPACQAYTIVHVEQGSHELHPEFAGHNPEPAQMQLQWPVQMPVSPPPAHIPTSVKAGIINQPRLASQEERPLILPNSPIPFLRKFVISFEWLIAISAAIFGLAVVYSFLAMALISLTGLKISR